MFFHDWNEWIQFNFWSQNLSIERNFFKWKGKVTKIWHLIFHRIWKKVVFLCSTSHRYTFSIFEWSWCWTVDWFLDSFEIWQFFLQQIKTKIEWCCPWSFSSNSKIHARLIPNRVCSVTPNFFCCIQIRNLDSSVIANPVYTYIVIQIGLGGWNWKRDHFIVDPCDTFWTWSGISLRGGPNHLLH